MEQLILIKYGELTTKKQNRKMFINLLYNNIKNLLKDNNITIIKTYDRMYIETNEIEEVTNKLQTIFGIHSIVICNKVNTNIKDIKNITLQLLSNTKFNTFKVETKRSYKQFELNSMEISDKIGGHILKNINCKVDVHIPDITVHIEVRQYNTYVYLNEIKGLGGYPVGVQGKGLLMLSGGIDSPVAGYLALKRGIDIECLYFESIPHTSLEARNKVLELANIINKYSGNIKVHVVNFTKMQEAIYKSGANDYLITIMRRMMYRIAVKVMEKNNCKVLINGESVGQVASQTLDSMIVINEVTNVPVIRPVACLDKLEIIDISKKIKTYDTSILPYEDCCTVFLPDHPVIKPKLDRCLLLENKIEYEKIIDESINSIITIDNFKHDFKDLL